MSPDPMGRVRAFNHLPTAIAISFTARSAIALNLPGRRAQIARFCCTLADKRTTLIGDEQASGVSRGLVARGPWLCMTACGRSG
jgi:hypothetical protein